MAFNCTFRFIDDMGRPTTRTYVSTATLAADAEADVDTLAAAFDAASEGGLDGVTISYVYTGANFAADATSNIDDNASVTVSTSGNYNHPFDLPMPVAALKLAGGSFDSDDALWTAITDLFAGGVGQDWRVNKRNPVTITGTVGGKIDK